LTLVSPAEGQVVIVGVTGASGAILAQTALRLLASDPRVARVHLVVSDAGLRLLDHELGIVAPLADLPAHLLAGSADSHAAAKIEVLPDADIGASIASGSYPVDAMCVIPCSMGMLSSIAAGASTDLVSRAADVALKEGRRLILCIRDTPFSRIHIENMLRVQQAGAVVMPAIPSFYHRPKTIDDLVTQYVCRVLAQLGLPQPRQFAWQGQHPNPNQSAKLNPPNPTSDEDEPGERIPNEHAPDQRTPDERTLSKRTPNRRGPHEHPIRETAQKRDPDRVRKARPA
jgi:4-hydroxy-3-polyprenylbenzoate decarboxylase